jgi:hypothetical protein
LSAANLFSSQKIKTFTKHCQVVKAVRAAVKQVERTIMGMKDATQDTKSLCLEDDSFEEALF